MLNLTLDLFNNICVVRVLHNATAITYNQSVRLEKLAKLNIFPLKMEKFVLIFCLGCLIRSIIVSNAESKSQRYQAMNVLTSTWTVKYGMFYAR